MNLIKIDLPNQNFLFVNVTNMDSNEEPESSCTNRLITFKVGDKLFNYFDQDPKVALDKFKGQICAMSELSLKELPEVAFCVIVLFKSDFFVDWSAIENHYHRSVAK
ncbi:hypothetical protein [Vibrio sp. SCSIO 43155]|uniref:hypothetical protein n=1 Tax=Vibrio sp. SCSIO 43155 TaxID=2819099 RepID=UPI002075A162|nr:hypothetical protein [Vibrio sp. SCSIO 43155]USD58459.1 hypothetical protein J4N44_27585 [Vibrio sp. SCSIO 43155]